MMSSQESICRICLMAEMQCVDIFKGKLECDIEEVPKMLQFCAAIEVIDKRFL